MIPVDGLLGPTVHPSAPHREPDLDPREPHGALPLEDLNTLSCVASTHLTDGNLRPLYFFTTQPLSTLSGGLRATTPAADIYTCWYEQGSTEAPCGCCRGSPDGRCHRLPRLRHPDAPRRRARRAAGVRLGGGSKSGGPGRRSSGSVRRLLALGGLAGRLERLGPHRRHLLLLLPLALQRGRFLSGLDGVLLLLLGRRLGAAALAAGLLGAAACFLGADGSALRDSAPTGS